MNASDNPVGGTGPRHLRDVTLEWLTECIRSQGDDGTVSNFTATQLGEGVGMMATLNRLTLRYSSGSGPATLIVKFPGELEANLAVAAQFGLFYREVRFYQRAAGRTTMHTPKIYAAEIDPNSEFVLLMEDLGEMRTGDQIVGCDADETAAAVDELVKLHSVFWNAVDTPEFDFAPIVDAEGQGDVMHSLAIASWDAMNAVHGDAVPPVMESIRQRFLAAIPAMHAWLGKVPLTLIHSDYRLDNLMLGTPPEHPAIVALDWQGVMRSKGIEDVAFLLSQSVPIEIRRRIEREQVERYRQGLLAAGIDYYATQESAWEDYRRCVLYLWMYAVLISGALDPRIERARKVMSAIVSRSATAIEDLDCLSLLPEFEDAPRRP